MLAAALITELGNSHQSVKTVMRWTGASERMVKYWFAGTHSPSARHLTILARNSDTVLEIILGEADRHAILIGIQLLRLKTKLLDLIDMIGPAGS